MSCEKCHVYAFANCMRNKRPVAYEAPLLHKKHFFEGQQQCSRALQSKFHSSINIYNRQNNETAGFIVCYAAS